MLKESINNDAHGRHMTNIAQPPLEFTHLVVNLTEGICLFENEDDPQPINPPPSDVGDLHSRLTLNLQLFVLISAVTPSRGEQEVR